MSRLAAAHSLLPSLLLLTITAASSAPAVAAEPEPGSHAAILVIAAGADDPLERINLGDRLRELEVGEVEEIVTDSGRLVRLTRTADGIDLELDGKTTKVRLFGEAFGEDLEAHSFDWTTSTENAEQTEIEKAEEIAQGEEHESVTNRHSRVVIKRHGADGEGLAYAFVVGDQDEEEAFAQAERLLAAGPRVMVFAGENGEVVHLLERREATDAGVIEGDSTEESGGETEATGKPQRVHKVIVIERAKPKTENDSEAPR